MLLDYLNRRAAPDKRATHNCDDHPSPRRAVGAGIPRLAHFAGGYIDELAGDQISTSIRFGLGGAATSRRAPGRRDADFSLIGWSASNHECLAGAWHPPTTRSHFGRDVTASRESPA
jgi:hypothetical protein